jgi:hypothetical protein
LTAWLENIAVDRLKKDFQHEIVLHAKESQRVYTQATFLCCAAGREKSISKQLETVCGEVNAA